MNIRLLTPADAQAYVAHRREMLLDAPWAFCASPDSDRGSRIEHVRTSLEQAAQAPTQSGAASTVLAAPNGYAILGAFDADHTLLSSCVLLREAASKRAHIAMLLAVYTTPAKRGQGLSARVIAAALDQARSWHGVSVVQLAVSEGSPAARRLYERLGFVAWGVEPDALRVDGRSLSETHMSLTL